MFFIFPIACDFFSSVFLCKQLAIKSTVAMLSFKADAKKRTTTKIQKKTFTLNTKCVSMWTHNKTHTHTTKEGNKTKTKQMYSFVVFFLLLYFNAKQMKYWLAMYVCAYREAFIFTAIPL